MSDHRLSRVLGYDGLRRDMHQAAKSAYVPAVGTPTDAKLPREEASTGKMLGTDGQEKKEGLVEKAIRRAKELVAPKPTPKPTPKRPPTGQKKVLDRKMNADTGELEEAPAASVKHDGYTLNNQISPEGSAFDGKKLGCDGKGKR